MAEYIKREALKEKIFERVNNPLIREWLERIINDIPAADVVEVVRCKNCKYYEQYPYSEDSEMMCRCWVDWLPTDCDDFCSFGERMGGEEE